jgi:hypothetical protein
MAAMRRTLIALGVAGALALSGCGAAASNPAAADAVASDVAGAAAALQQVGFDTGLAPAQSGSAQSGSAQSGSAQAGAAESGSAQAGAAESGSAQAGAAESGSAQAGSAESGSAQSASAQAGDAPRRPIRRYLRKNTLHGEIVVQTKNDGVQTVLVQRGAVTAVTSGGVTVKSADGFTLTWTFGPNLRIVQNKEAVQASALKTGQEIGVAGIKDDNSDIARLIAIK